MIIGWDISTSAIGCCVMSDIPSFFIVFPKGNTAEEKQQSAIDGIKVILEGLSIDVNNTTHVVEDRLQGFTKGLTTMQTILALAAMNAVVSFYLRSYGKVLKVHPSSVKSAFGLRPPKDPEQKKNYDPKVAAVRLVQSLVPSFPYAETAGGNLQKGVSDQADAWIMASFGMKVIAGEIKLEPRKKNRINKRSTRSTRTK